MRTYTPFFVVAADIWNQSMNDNQIVHIIDDDHAILNSISGFLQTNGFTVQTYLSAGEFLKTAGPETAGCVVTDVLMPNINGIELMGKMKERGLLLPTIIMTASADIPLTVQAMQQDAADLLQKPFNNGALVKAIRKALASRVDEAAVRINAETVRTRFSKLTSREKEVLAGMLEGTSNQLIADQLGISVRILETDRATIMSKMEAVSIADLVRMSLDLANHQAAEIR
jgi:two-component system, LuxR family, response regulator FixJ